MTWRPPNPATHVEQHYRSDSLKASVADLVEQLHIVRSERDEARRQHRQSERRRLILLDEVTRIKAQQGRLVRALRKPKRKPAQSDSLQLPLF